MRRCPQCGSSDLFQIAGGYLGSEYHCKRCGYRGAFIVESDEEMPHPEVRDTESSGMNIPLWIRIVAVIFLLIVIWIALPGW
ncbi:MAG: Uncharacterized protein XD88_0763 [Methanocalculus sp. 52_23]|nr:MAG: Uncharacterized protein XD88_0763 [Methanocalculus sp. 52_23]